MQCWINGPGTGGIDDKIKMDNILLKTNIPSFQYSIIPFSGRIRKPQKNLHILHADGVIEIPGRLINRLLLTMPNRRWFCPADYLRGEF